MIFPVRSPGSGVGGVNLPPVAPIGRLKIPETKACHVLLVQSSRVSTAQRGVVGAVDLHTCHIFGRITISNSYECFLLHKLCCRSTSSVREMEQRGLDILWGRRRNWFSWLIRRMRRLAASSSGRRLVLGVIRSTGYCSTNFQ